MKKFKVQTVLVLDYKKGSNRKIFHSSVKLIPSDTDNDKAFKSMHQRDNTTIKNCACKDRVILEVIMKYSINIFEC